MFNMLNNHERSLKPLYNLLVTEFMSDNNITNVYKSGSQNRASIKSPKKKTPYVLMGIKHGFFSKSNLEVGFRYGNRISQSIRCYLNGKYKIVVLNQQSFNIDYFSNDNPDYFSLLLDPKHHFICGLDFEKMVEVESLCKKYNICILIDHSPKINYYMECIINYLKNME